MLTALHGLLAALPAHASLLDLLLPRVTRLLQADFVHWVDGGAGVGSTGLSYMAVLDHDLDVSLRPESRVHCYDPLPENVSVLRERLGHDARFVIRDVALASSSGQAHFSIPSRIGGSGAGAWAPGTSYAGTLKKSAAAQESLQVTTVRLEDEPIPRLDFVKLDLQGAELEALLGLGARIREPKVLYVEAQLLGGAEALPFLLDQGFLPFFDRLQFGLRTGVSYLPQDVLASCGIKIDRMHLPQASGMPLVCWGHFDAVADIVDPKTLALHPKVSAALRDAGVSYLQTDALCLNVDWVTRLAPLLLYQ